MAIPPRYGSKTDYKSQESEWRNCDSLFQVQVTGWCGTSLCYQPRAQGPIPSAPLAQGKSWLLILPPLLPPPPSPPLPSLPTDHLASILCFLFFPRWPCLQPKLHNSPYQLQATCMNIPGQTGHLSSRSHSELSRVPFRTWRLPQDYLPCLSFWAWEISTSRYQLKLQMEALYSPGLSCHSLTTSAGIMD